jgi:hypothetical protein
LRVTAYDRTGYGKDVLHQAFEEVRQILRAAGIEAHIVEGDPTASEASFLEYHSGLAGVQRAQAVCRARRDIALRIGAAPRQTKAGVLGMALPLAARGLNAVVYSDRTAEAATRENVPYAVVLAHAVAHEIGHVLLRTETHEQHGIMASVWRSEQYDRLATGSGMRFTREEAQRMRSTLRGGNPDLRAGPERCPETSPGALAIPSS